MAMGAKMPVSCENVNAMVRTVPAYLGDRSKWFN